MANIAGPAWPLCPITSWRVRRYVVKRGTYAFGVGTEPRHQRGREPVPTGVTQSSGRLVQIGLGYELCLGHPRAKVFERQAQELGYRGIAADSLDVDPGLRV